MTNPLQILPSIPKENYNIINFKTNIFIFVLKLIKFNYFIYENM